MWKQFYLPNAKTAQTRMFAKRDILGGRRHVTYQKRMSLDDTGRFLLEVARLLNISTQRDWECVKNETILKIDRRLSHVFQVQSGTCKLLDWFPGHFWETLKSIHPGLNWMIYKPKRITRNYWNTPENQYLFFGDIARALQLKTYVDWTILSTQSVKQFGGRTVLSHHCESVIEVFKSLHPELIWWKFIKIMPKNFWKTSENHHLFIDQLAYVLHIKTHNDWKTVSNRMIIQYGGSYLLKLYNNSLLGILKIIHPELNIMKFYYDKVGRKHWSTLENQRLYLEEIACRLNIQIQCHWKIFNTETIKKSKSATFFSLHISIFEMLNSLYPELNWNNYDRQENHFYHFNKIAMELALQTFEDWQQMTSKNINIYNIFENFTTIYPEFNWHPLALARIPRNLWNNPEYCRQFVNMLENHYDIQNKIDWYRLSCDQVTQVLGRSFSRKKLFQMLQFVFPEEEWNYNKFSQKNKKSRQWWLFLKIKEIFKNETVIENFHHKGILRETGIPLELDIFLPNLNLAFEFHGEQHYIELPFKASLEVRWVRDKEKVALCLAHGIKLIIIPYWWDNKVESLLSTLYKECPSITLCVPDVDIKSEIPILQPPYTIPNFVNYYPI